MRVMCAYGPQAERSDREKDKFCNKMACEWDFQNPGEMFPGLGDFNGHIGRRIDNFEGVNDEY